MGSRPTIRTGSVIGRVDYNKSDKNQMFGRYYIYNYTAQAFFDGKNALTTGPNPGNHDETRHGDVGRHLHCSARP